MLDGAVFFAIIEEENEVIWMVQDRNPEYFLAIASEKSISKAAERLHISQPYLSQYVIHLEKEFGVRLLDRTKSPLALTAAMTDEQRTALRGLLRSRLGERFYSSILAREKKK